MVRETSGYTIGASREQKIKYTTDLIKTITLKRGMEIPAEAEASWDVSYNSDDSIIAYVIPNDGLYDLYICFEDMLAAPSNSSGLFRNYTKCTEINNLELLYTGAATRMDSMFADNNVLENLSRN